MVYQVPCSAVTFHVRYAHAKSRVGRLAGGCFVLVVVVVFQSINNISNRRSDSQEEEVLVTKRGL